MNRSIIFITVTLLVTITTFATSGYLSKMLIDNSKEDLLDPLYKENTQVTLSTVETRGIEYQEDTIYQEDSQDTLYDDDSQDTLYQDVIITALERTINRSIDAYYQDKLSYLPGFDFSNIKIVSIERPNGDRTAVFIITLEVTPYVGPHIQVGKDRITIRISFSNQPEVVKFEHLEDYPLPEHYQDIYLSYISFGETI